MEHKIYFTEFPCYEQATEKQKKYLSGKQYFNLDLLPSENLRREIEPFIRFTLLGDWCIYHEVRADLL